MSYVEEGDEARISPLAGGTVTLHPGNLEEPLDEDAWSAKRGYSEIP